MWLIREKAEAPQQFPLRRLFEVSISTLNRNSDDSLLVMKAEGYGKEVCNLDVATLSSEEGLAISIKDMRKILEDEDQWFYDLILVDSEANLQFGISDSSFLFVDGPPWLCNRILPKFDTSTITKRNL